MGIKWKKTPEIDKLLIRIEVAKSLINLLPSLPSIETRLQRESLLKSSLFSAKIEGNTLSYNQIEHINVISPKEKEKKEIFNILKASTILKKIEGKLTLEKIKQIHAVVMEDLSAESGFFRNEPSAIFNTAGVAIYMTPPPTQIVSQLNEFLEFVNATHKNTSIADVAVSHYQFEKIHPFLDGNGRVGRLLSSFHLKKLGFGFKNLVSFEEFLLENREDYYYGLSLPKKDITDFVLFFLTAIATTAEKMIEKLQNKKEETPEDSLLPRRAEILNIIRDHQILSFDQIRRRFLKVGERSLHYDLMALVKLGLIKKLGGTRGAQYVPAKTQ